MRFCLLQRKSKLIIEKNLVILFLEVKHQFYLQLVARNCKINKHQDTIPFVHELHHIQIKTDARKNNKAHKQDTDPQTNAINLIE